MLFSRKGHMRIEVHTDVNWAGCLDDRSPLLAIVHSWEVI
jgi:hypothetical protein